MPRTDVHRPSQITVEDYEFVALECIKIQGLEDLAVIQEERATLKAHMERTGGTYSQHAHGGNCHVCGNANAIYTALFYHAPSNSYIRMGRDCSAKCEMGDERRFRRMTDAIEAAREARAGKLKAQGVLLQEGLSGAWEVYSKPWKQGDHQDTNTIRDIVEKLVRYGSLSVKQINFLRMLVERIPQRGAVEAKRQAERDAAQPVPTGRLQVNVEVVSVKAHDSGFGTRMVMTVKAEEGGWLAWGTAPAGLERGDMVTMTASFSPSDRDPKFGFFKRPHVVSKVSLFDANSRDKHQMDAIATK